MRDLNKHCICRYCHKSYKLSDGYFDPNLAPDFQYSAHYCSLECKEKYPQEKCDPCNENDLQIVEVRIADGRIQHKKFCKVCRRGTFVSVKTPEQRQAEEDAGKEKLNELKANRLKKLYGDTFYTTPEWIALKTATVKRYGAVCMKCGAIPRPPGLLIHVDHIKPRSRFPELELDPENLQILCGPCNEEKSNVHFTDYRNPFVNIDLAIREWTEITEQRPNYLIVDFELLDQFKQLFQAQLTQTEQELFYKDLKVIRVASRGNFTEGKVRWALGN